ncbi:MAG: DNA polymerase III subunit delta' [Lachnospiraceae bacterium]|nr:DNA polymerase III subunit delta' [Lachnospiraceae bacterium]
MRLNGTGFQGIIGHRNVIRHLTDAMQSGRISHAYLFTGEDGSGKRMMADAFAMALVCRDKSRPAPCLICPSCRKAADHNHPDILYVMHEKPNLLSVDEIRTQVVNTVEIRPYESEYKIYIIADAEKMNPQAQNALLKTIEEPPSYAVIILLTSRPEALLPTIHSRCVTLPLLPVPDREVDEYLRREVHLPDYEARMLTAFAQGNIGKAVLAATDGAFAERRERTLQLIRNLPKMDSAAIGEIVRQWKEDREHTADRLDLIQMWFRDVLCYKATYEIDQLIFSGEISAIRAQASGTSYEGLSEILSAVDRCRMRLAANVNFELAAELLLYTIRDECHSRGEM